MIGARSFGARLRTIGRFLADSEIATTRRASRVAMSLRLRFHGSFGYKF
jgi:hypothetical protein